MTEKREVWCWICEDPESCDMCKPEAPGQLDLFAQDEGNNDEADQ